MHPGVHAVHSPAKPAAVQAETGEVLTYATLADNSRRLARYLHDQGLRPDDHLALLTDNTLRAFEVHWAALRSGLHITAVNRHLTPDEISYIVDDCGAKALVVSARLKDLVERLGVPGVAVRLAYGVRSGPGRPDGGRPDRDLPEAYTPTPRPWPRPPTSLCRTCRAAPTCCTPPGPPGGPRGYTRNSPAWPWTRSPRWWPASSP